MPYKTSLVLSVFLLFVTLVAVGAPSAFAQRSRFTARQVIEIIQKEIGAPRDPETVDTFKAGDPDTPVTGIATTFLATFDVLKRAAASGKNLVITHEPTFYNHRDETALFQSDPVFREKATFIRDHHLIVWRFHDLWHSRTPDPMVESFTRRVGWEKYRNVDEHNIFVLPTATVLQLAMELQRSLHSHSLRLVGDPQMRITKIAYLPGFSGEEREVKLLEREDVEVLLTGESAEWEAVEYVRDATAQHRRKALILLGHQISEEPGMEYCAQWLRRLFPEIPVQFIPAGQPFQIIQRP